MRLDRATVVWAAGEEPAEFSCLGSPDDRDWVAWVPHGVPDPEWAASGSPFGCCAVERFQLPLGAGTVLVGFHA